MQLQSPLCSLAWGPQGLGFPGLASLPASPSVAHACRVPSNYLSLLRNCSLGYQ